MRIITVMVNLIVNITSFHSMMDAIFTIDIKSHHTPPQRRQSPEAAPQQVQRPTIDGLSHSRSKDLAIL